jgi:membrane protease subunit HflC
VKNSIGFLVFLAVAGLIVVSNAVFILTEGRQAIITQFGKPVGEPVREAGLHFKTPFLQDVRLVDKRILNWDGFPNQIPTKDKKYIKVDTTARWRIVDALKFIQTVRNEAGAKSRLDAILDSATRDIISNHHLVEAVRNSNGILKKIEEKVKQQENAKKNNQVIVEEETSGEVEQIKVGREKLSELIVQEASKELTSFGIELIDVQLRRISYEKSVEAKVYERMISERQRIAEKIRSIGQGEKARIEGLVKEELQKIKSEAYKSAQIIKGEAEAEVVKLYAKAMGKNKDFYEFMRSMELYKKTLKKDSSVFLSTDSPIFKYIKSNQ